MEILDEVKKDYVMDLIQKGLRPDERKFDEYRPIKVEKGIIPSAEGSARVHLGKTQVLVGVKIATATPFPDRPKEGVFSTNAELLPLASPTFEPGPPSAQSIELARVVDRGIRSSKAIDTESLFIEDGKVWAVYADIYVLDHDGNLIDASALAAMTALLDTKMPKYEDGKVIREQKARLPIHAKCVSTTFAKIGNSIVLDPGLDEEKAMGARLTLATTDKHVCAGQKGGSAGFTKGEMLDLVDLAFKKGSELRALL